MSKQNEPALKSEATVGELKLYQPSNGTEGDYFMEKYCDNCYHESGRGNESPEGSCPILISTMFYDIKDDKYPNQWRYVDGKETCIAFFDRRKETTDEKN
jgi:hypothetical protein